MKAVIILLLLVYFLINEWFNKKMSMLDSNLVNANA